MAFASSDSARITSDEVRADTGLDAIDDVTLRVRRPGEGLLHVVLSPVMRLWRLAVLESWLSSPRPKDPPYGFVEGSDPIRVLLLGGSAAAGLGVATHNLGLVGAICKQLATATGRGVELEACAGVGMTLRELVERVRDLPAVYTGLVMFIPGINDALRLTSLRSWRRDLRVLLDLLRGDAAWEVRVLLVDVPPVDSLPFFARLPRRIAAWHGRLLNGCTRRVVADLDYVRLVHFPPLGGVGVDVLPDPVETYRRWAAELTVALAEAVLPAASTQDRTVIGSSDSLAREELD